MTVLETPRLVLRRWRDGDVAPMAAINADPQVMQWIGDGSVRDVAQTRAAIAGWERGWDDHGFGLFAVELRETGELVGFAGLAVPEFLPQVLPAVEIGWRLGRAYWGRGLATEAAREVVRFAFDEGGLDRIVSIVQLGNDASDRVAAKLGMTPGRELTDGTCGRPVRVYELARRRRGGVVHAAVTI